MCIAWYIAPIFPLLTRAALVVRFPHQMREVLSEDEQDRDQNRSIILALAGFSFTGVLAVAVLDLTQQRSFALTVFFLLVSFLAYLWALNVQGYKALRWHGEMSTGLVEVGSLGLVLSLVSLLQRGERPILMSALALTVWLVDHMTRLRIEYRYLKAKEDRRSREVRSDDEAVEKEK